MHGGLLVTPGRERSRKSLPWMYSFARFGIRDPKRTDPGRITAGTLFEVIARVPDRAVFGRVDCGLGIVLPAVRVGLRGLSLDKDPFVQRQLAQRVVRPSACKALAGVVRCPAEGVPDAEVAHGVE